MNENLNLAEILKDCPKGTKLYSPIYGDVELVNVLQGEGVEYPIQTKISDNTLDGFTKDGRMFAEYKGECMLFPSRDERNWSNFKVKKPKFDPNTLKAFDKVIARITDSNLGMWYADFISVPADELNPIPCVMGDKDFDIIIPYNDDTKHLVGTSDEAPEFYRYW